MWSGVADLGYLGAFTALKVLDLRCHETVTILPKSLGNLKWLVELDLGSCRELLIVEALPEGLERLYLRGCIKLTKIPSFSGMRSLVELEVRYCRSLRHVDRLDYISRFHSEESKVGVGYNSRWLENKLAVQVISWYGDGLRVMSCGVWKKVLVNEDVAVDADADVDVCEDEDMDEDDYEDEREREVVMYVMVFSKAECIALIWFIVANDATSMEVKVWRSGKLVLVEKCSVDCHPPHISVSLFTWRKSHVVVQSLQYGDMVSFHIMSERDPPLPPLAVEMQGGVCMVHKYDEDLVMVMNSEVLSKIDSEKVVSQFGEIMISSKEDSFIHRYEDIDD